MKTLTEAVLFLLKQHDTAEDAAGDKARLIGELETQLTEDQDTTSDVTSDTKKGGKK